MAFDGSTPLIKQRTTNPWRLLLVAALAAVAAAVMLLQGGGLATSFVLKQVLNETADNMTTAGLNSTEKITEQEMKWQKKKRLEESKQGKAQQLEAKHARDKKEVAEHLAYIAEQAAQANSTAPAAIEPATADSTKGFISELFAQVAPAAAANQTTGEAIEAAVAEGPSDGDGLLNATGTAAAPAEYTGGDTTVAVGNDTISVEAADVLQQPAAADPAEDPENDETGEDVLISVDPANVNVTMEAKLWNGTVWNGTGAFNTWNPEANATISKSTKAFLGDMADAMANASAAVADGVVDAAGSVANATADAAGAVANGTADAAGSVVDTVGNTTAAAAEVANVTALSEAQKEAGADGEGHVGRRVLMGGQ